MTYLIIKEKTVYHEGDERSRKYPGHGYPAWNETVQSVEYFHEYATFLKRCDEYTRHGDKFRAFGANEYEIQTKTEITLKEKN